MELWFTIEKKSSWCSTKNNGTLIYYGNNGKMVKKVMELTIVNYV